MVGNVGYETVVPYGTGSAVLVPKGTYATVRYRTISDTVPQFKGFGGVYIYSTYSIYSIYSIGRLGSLIYYCLICFIILCKILNILIKCRTVIDTERGLQPTARCC